MHTPNISSPAKYQAGDVVDSVNWNAVDQMDLDIWNRLTSNFWLPEAIPVSNDSKSWARLTEEERWSTMQVFAGLTLLDTLQGTVGAVSLIPYSENMHEEAVYTNISFMESVHAKSYSNIFITLAPTRLINQAFQWARENEALQYKARRILEFYQGDDPLRKKVASVMLESFLFYSGFYLPLRWSSHGELTNTADIIRLIIRDEAVHGYYIGYKFQQQAGERHEELHSEVSALLMDLYENELKYTSTVYDPIGWTEDVNAFLRYNANKSMMNLGYEALFPVEDTQFSPGVMTSLDPSANENHDFFSGAGSSYVVGRVEETSDDDWDY